MSKKRTIKAAQLRLKLMGITEDNPIYQPRDVIVRHKTITTLQADEIRVAASMREETQVKFEKIPVIQRVNPYRQLLNAMIDGTFTDEMRQQIELLGTGMGQTE